MAEEGKPKTNPLFLSLDQYEKVEKAPVGLVIASQEKDQWYYSIPPNRSEYNFIRELKRVVLRGDGFAIPVSAGSAFSNGEGTKLAITAKMRETAILEIWMLTSNQGGSSAQYFKIKLAEIPTKSEQDGGGQPATRPESK
jgi:hypothetical protein